MKTLILLVFMSLLSVFLLTGTAYAVCGDGIIDGGEECDDGDTNDNNACRNDCTIYDPYFTDVPGSHWAFEYVQQLYEYAISQGFPDGTYKPGKNVTRAEMSAFIIRTVEIINALEARVADLETLLANITRNGNDIYVDGANLHVRSGSGSTGGTVNGLGNIIIGYDELRTSGTETCSLGDFTDQITCESNGGVWALNHKSGSHNLVVGNEHNYSRYGGVVVGDTNQISGIYSSVSGGITNIASGDCSSVSGGIRNEASGEWSSVSGGFKNTASGEWSSVSGGTFNTASLSGSSVSGGQLNEASGQNSSVSGGSSNEASGVISSVSGGDNNTASGQNSSVSGGNSNTANGDNSSVSGGQLNEASATDSSVSGGSSNEASGGSSAVCGGFNRNVSGTSDWRAGGLFEDF